MKVTRKIKVETDKFKVGDIISFTLTDGEKIRARAIKKRRQWYAVLLRRLPCHGISDERE